MPIIPLLSSGFFDPEATKIDGGVRYRLANVKNLGQRSRCRLSGCLYTRELLAKRIIETARQGERDAIRLVDDALSHLANSN